MIHKMREIVDSVSLSLSSSLSLPFHSHTYKYRYIPVRYMQAMGTFEYALQLYRSVLRFFFGASKEVKERII